MKKNVAFVAIDPNLECSWRYVIPAKSEYISGVVEEMLSISSCIFKSIDSFARPLHVTYAIGTSNTNYRIASLFDSTVSTSLDISRESSRDDTGIPYDAFAQPINEYQTNKENTKVLTLIHLDEMKTKIYLKDGEHYLSRSSREAKIWRHKIRQGDPWHDPLSIELRLNRPREEISIPSYTLTVSTATDIWFEDTEYGRKNRTRLSRLLTRLYESFEEPEVKIHSNRLKHDELRSLVSPGVDEGTNVE